MVENDHFGMTALGSGQFVYKNHPRIRLRGAIDSLKAKVLVFMAQLHREEKRALLDDLKEVLPWIQRLQRVEVTEEPVGSLFFHDFDTETVHYRSHHPQKYYGVPHIFDLSYRDNPDLLMVNELRTWVRRVELLAFDAHLEKDSPLRKDVVTALNRLSSAFYLIELTLCSAKSSPS